MLTWAKRLEAWRLDREAVSRAADEAASDEYKADLQRVIDRTNRRLSDLIAKLAAEWKERDKAQEVTDGQHKTTP